MSTIRLSICIPVYNFGAFIGETLESIIQQATLDIEIVVVDGASTDNTSEIISRYQKKFRELRYYRLEKRGGIDRDMARSVDLARGEYCWLFGGDDIMKPGSIARVIKEISSGIDLFLCESILCGFDLRPIKKHKMLAIDTDRVFDLGNENDRLLYFRSALNTAAFFSFCSSLIFKKKKWDQAEIDDSFMGSHWAHAARIFAMIPHGLKVKYLFEPCLYKRGDNDSFLDRGLVYRYQFAIEGYHRLADTFFNNRSVEAFHIRRVVRYEFPVPALLSLKLDSHDKKRHEDQMIVDRLVSMVNIDPLLSNRISLFLYKSTPLFLFKLLRSIYRMLTLLLRRLR
jgi:abequosyltransferase